MGLFENSLNTNECYVYFAFDGDDFNPEKITEILKIEPTKIKRKGERRNNKSSVKFKYSSWILSTEKIINEIIDVDEMASSIIKILKPKTDLINAIRRKYNVSTRLEVVLWMVTDESQTTPMIALEVENIDFLAKVGAYLDIDIYRN